MEDDGKLSNYMDASRITRKGINNQRIRPKFYKLMGQIMNYHMEVNLFLILSQF